MKLDEMMNLMGIGDWGLGIGPSPIPNPPSPNLKNLKFKLLQIFFKIFILKLLRNYSTEYKKF